MTFDTKLFPSYRVMYWKRYREEGIAKGRVVCSEEEAEVIEIEVRKPPYTNSVEFDATIHSERLKAKQIMRLLEWSCENGAMQRSRQINLFLKFMGVIDAE